MLSCFGRDDRFWFRIPKLSNALPTNSNQPHCKAIFGNQQLAQFYPWNAFFQIIDKIAVVIFIIDYVLRLITADYKFEKSNIASFLHYPFSCMAIIDLLSILPSLTVVNSGFKVLRVLRMIRAMKVLRIFKIMRYSRNFEIIVNVMNNLVIHLKQK